MLLTYDEPNRAILLTYDKLEDLKGGHEAAPALSHHSHHGGNGLLLAGHGGGDRGLRRGQGAENNTSAYTHSLCYYSFPQCLT